MANPFHGPDGDGNSTGLPANAKDVCPIFGLQTTPVPKGGVVRGMVPEFEIRLSYPACIKGPCHLWDADAGMCCIKSAALQMVEVVRGLAPLKGFFGNR